MSGSLACGRIPIGAAGATVWDRGNCDGLFRGVLTGVSVAAKNVNTGETRLATSNDVGQFAIPNLQAGVYEVSAEKQGFQRKIVDQVTLEVQAVRSIDMVLPPGTVSEQVNVTAAATALQTTESSVSTLFESKVVSEIPLNGRDFLQLQLLSPGTTLASAGTFTAVQIASQNLDIGGGNFSVNGMRDVYNDYIIDGVSFKDWMHGTNGLNPSVDAIQEFRLQTGNYSAEFGANAGGLVNMVTKSGSNQIHGNLYDFLRNDKLDATNFFTGRAGEKKTPLRRNQFGGTVGGPIIRDKTFFFFSYEGFREQSSTTLFDNFPTQLMRGGDFSELLNLPTPIIISDPATGLPYRRQRDSAKSGAERHAGIPGHICSASQPSRFGKQLCRTGIAQQRRQSIHWTRRSPVEEEPAVVCTLHLRQDLTTLHRQPTRIFRLSSTITTTT